MSKRQYNDDGFPLDANGDLDYPFLAKIVQKIARSFIFFVSQYCWIENKLQDGERAGETKFTLWPMQRPVAVDFLMHRLIVILKARQLGLTWLTAAYCLWKVITQRGMLIVVISAKEEWAIEFLDRVKFMYKRLPSWLQLPLDREGSQHMRFVYEWDDQGRPLVYSDIKSLTTTQEGAQSKTPDILVMDETARNRYAKSIYGASKPGIDKAGGQIIVISNSHKRGPGWPWTRDICSGALKGENTFHMIFLPPWACPERLTDDERSRLREDPHYIPVHFKKQQILDGVDPEDVSENYPDTIEEALSPSSGSYFGDALARHASKYFIKGHQGTLLRERGSNEIFFKAHRTQFKDKGPNVFTIWRHPYFLTSSWIRGEYWADRYVIGTDVSEGTGNSFSVAYVMDRKYDELVARVRSNRIDAVLWAKCLKLLSEYYCNFYISGNGTRLGHEDAMICVERTGAGITTVKELEKKDANQYIRQLVGKRGDHDTDIIGWHEDRASKHELCGDLRNWFRHCKGHIYDSLLIDEASTTIEHEGGMIGPEKGKMWDSVVAAGCTLQASLQIGAKPYVVKPNANPYQQSTASNWGR